MTNLCPSSDIALFALQGLGNSVINIPIVARIARQHRVTLLAMDNGSYDLYHERFPSVRVVRIRQVTDLLRHRAAGRCSFALFPNARREYLATLLCRAERKYFFRDPIARCSHLNWFRKLDYRRCHDIENNLRVLDALNLGYSADDFRPVVGEPGETGLAAVHPTASSPVKYYPVDFWVALLTGLALRGYGIRLYSGSGAVEGEYCTSILERLGPSVTVEYRRQLPVKQVFDEIGRSQLFVGADSALMHMAALQDVKTVGLWSFADYRRIYPYGNHVQVYIPRETVAAEWIQGYPKSPPAYLERADPSCVLDLADGRVSPDFFIAPRFKKAVSFVTF